MVRPRIEDKLKRTLRDEYGAKWASFRARTAERVKDSALRFADLEELMLEIIDIFQEAQKTDKAVDECNEAAPSGAPLLQHTELVSRQLSRFTRDAPSLPQGAVVLCDFATGKQIWPPRPQSIGVLVAAAMAPAPDPRNTDNWASAYDERRAQQAADQQRVAEYYARQEQERQEREAREAQERAPRSG